MLPTIATVPGKVWIPRALVFSLLALIGLGSKPADAQVTYTGTTANQNLGSQAIGSTGSAKTFSFSIAAGTTVGSIGVLTQGAPNLDFNSASGSTCTATTYSSASTCNVNVTLTPAVSGLRMGAIVFFTGSGNAGTILGSLPIYGIGLGPQLAFGPPVATVTLPTINGLKPDGMFDLAEDGFGNLYTTGSEVNGDTQVIEFPAGGGAQIAIDPTVDGKQVHDPASVAVDGAGNLFIGDFTNDRVVEVPSGGGAAFAIAPVVDGLPVVADLVRVDVVGDLFIVDQNNNRIVEVPAGGAAPISIAPTVNGKGFDVPGGAVVDAQGNLFVEDSGNNRILEIPASGAPAFVLNTTVNGQAAVGNLALDPAGDLFIQTGVSGAAIVEVPPGGTARVAFPNIATTYGNAVEYPGLVVDGLGNVFLPAGVPFSQSNDQLALVALMRPTSPSLSFPSVTTVGSTDTYDGTKTVQVQNVGNQPVTFSGLTFPADFSEASGDSAACTGSTTLSQGQPACDIPVIFTPENGGTLSEEVTSTGLFNVQVNGTGLAPSVLTSPAPGTTLLSSSQTFTWTASSAANAYFLSIGTSTGGHDVYSGSTAGALSLTATNLPLNGETLYVTLVAACNGCKATDADAYSYYVFATKSLASMTSPTTGSVLTGPAATFTWAPGNGATGYALWLGTTGVGSHDLLEGGVHTATTLTFNNLPTIGQTVYARLWTSFNGTLQSTDYSYTEATQAVLTSPSSGSYIGATVTFNWTAGTEAAGYALWLGTTGAGSHDLLEGGIQQTTTRTVNPIPSSGGTVYVRLWTSFNGVLVYNDYAFVAAQAAMTSPAPSSSLPGPNVTFNWTTGGSSPTGYALWLGTTGAGSHDLLETGVHPTTSYTFTGLPTKGQSIYARLWTSVGGMLTYADYRYSEAQQATLAVPSPGTTLSGANVTFSWTSGISATGYAIWIGSTGVGSYNLYSTGVHSTTSASVTGLPTNGEPIYVRLFTSFGGILSYTDYTYTAATAGP